MVVTVGTTDEGKDVGQWLRVACFGETARAIASRGKKGDRVYVEGTLTLNATPGAADNTARKVRGSPFKPGAEWKGNAAGRPKGARNVISQRFLEDMLTVWNEPNEAGNKTGIDAIRTVAATKPGAFITAMSNLVPRELSFDDEAQEGFAAVWAALAKASASRDE